MSGIYILVIAFIVLPILAFGAWMYLKETPVRGGKVKTDAPPSEKELKRADPDRDEPDLGEPERGRPR